MEPLTRNKDFIHKEPISIKDLKSVDENGNPIDLKKRDARQEQSYYWGQKMTLIGLLLALSMIYFIVTILDKSELIQKIWTLILSSIWNFILKALGM